MTDNIIRWAKRFASAGFYVFPLYSAGGKNNQKPFGWARNPNPKLPSGDHVDTVKVIAATNVPSEVDEWPARVKMAYRGEVTGYGIMGIGCIIVDLDVKEGKKGLDEYRRLEKKYSVPLPEMLVKSKSGGMHLYFRKPTRYASAEVKSIAGWTIDGEKYDGVDVRGDGGMVIGPLSEGKSAEWTPGQYMLVKGCPEEVLSEMTEKLTYSVVRTSMRNTNDDVEAMISSYTAQEEDLISSLRAGKIPKVLPAGQRNEGFFAFVSGLKNKGIPRESVKVMCEQLAKVCEHPETLHESVNVDEMIGRVYNVNLENPFDIARDLITQGLYQIMSYKAKIHYVLFEENPYLVSRSPHDEGSMRTLMARYTRTVEQPNGKPKSVNPMDVIVRTLPDSNKVDSIGFKPGAPAVYSLSDDAGARRFLNTYNAPFVPTSPTGLDDTIFDEFKFIIGRIFGDPGSEEFQLGMDFSAWFLQCPGIKPAISPYVMSRNRGVGKSLYIHIMGLLAGISKSGDRQCKLTKVSEIGNRFFDPSGALLTIFDEVQFPVHKDMKKESATFWSALKNLVTSEVVGVEIKGGAVYDMPNLSALMMAGNSGSNFPIEEYDRRIWVIDNNPPELAKGLVDRLFLLMKNQGMSSSERRRLVYTLRYWLSKHEIKLPLDTMRAPMSQVKMDMYLSSLTDIEEWWITHFDDHDNLLSKTSILSKSAVIYLIETTERLMNTKYRDDPESTFRDLKRRGLLRPIRTKSNPNQSRNMLGVATVTPNGDLRDNDRREVLYTSRNHGHFDDLDNGAIIGMYNENVSSIKSWKVNKVKSGSTARDLIH